MKHLKFLWNCHSNCHFIILFFWFIETEGRILMDQVESLWYFKDKNSNVLSLVFICIHKLFHAITKFKLRSNTRNPKMPKWLQLNWFSSKLSLGRKTSAFSEINSAYDWIYSKPISVIYLFRHSRQHQYWIVCLKFFQKLSRFENSLHSVGTWDKATFIQI